MNLRELLIGNPSRLRYVVRFSTCHTVHKESVAEHSYYVALYALLISEWLVFEVQYDFGVVGLCRETLLRDALLHDFEEAITGDVNRVFKYSDPAIKEALDIGGELALRTIVHKLQIDCDMNAWAWRWRHCKQDGYEGRILDFCDFLSVLSYVVQELTNANITMQEHWTTMWEYFEKFKAEEFDFLRELVDDAGALLTEAFAKVGK